LIQKKKKKKKKKRRRNDKKIKDRKDFNDNDIIKSNNKEAAKTFKSKIKIKIIN
jgi:hypothetical protein